MFLLSAATNSGNDIIFKPNFLIVRCNFSSDDNILAPNFLFRGSRKRGLSLNSIVLPVLFSLFFISKNFSELINQIISKVEQIKKSKSGKPLGKGNYGYIDLTKVEAPYSKISLDLLLADLMHLNDLILSMKSMLDEQSLFVNSSLMSDTILYKIDTIKKLINSS